MEFGTFPKPQPCMRFILICKLMAIADAQMQDPAPFIRIPGRYRQTSGDIIVAVFREIIPIAVGFLEKTDTPAYMGFFEKIEEPDPRISARNDAIGKRPLHKGHIHPAV